uniref:RNP domain-containing protein n=1 Tax=Kwoniella bestiolae CBS 10118 TaxID=1296100 RepID=A0A1B9FV16_9TREE|nr:RNP domain-containing protein [Kwoniella bestiolae CBS 10118]OCF22616.1 RNP domain-containing protein [Kwoniella bestiolae CBS 10118]
MIPQHRRRSYSRSRSRSRTRSPGRHRHRHHSRSRSRDRDYKQDRDRDYRSSHRDYRSSSDRYGGSSYRGGPRGGRGLSGGYGRNGYGGGHGAGRPTSGPGPNGEQSVGGPMNATQDEAEAHAKISKRENRLYVGNLAYDVTYKDLSNFMSSGQASHFSGGNVIFSEVLTTPAGQSKGCGIVEFATQEDAQRAKAELTDKYLLSRNVFIREDREETARFGAPPIPGKIGVATGEARTFLGNAAPVFPVNPMNKNVFVGNLPLQASWQDLKDLMRQAGEVIRADINFHPDGNPRGNGTVVFVNPDDARAAIEMFNGFDWFGNILECKPDKFANMPFGPGRGRGGFRGGFPPRGGFGGFRGGFRGGFMGGPGFGGAGRGMGFNAGYAAQGGRSFNDNIYADYNGPEGGEGMAVDGAGAGGSGLKPQPAEPNQQILVRNLPWSTANEDLVELFETVGNVVSAEVLFEAGRSKGEGIVQFTETAEAQTAGEKFTGYMYGGRPLDVQFNPRWHEFSSAAVKGGQVAPA